MPVPFEPRFVDLVRNFTTTAGTGNFVLGAAVGGFSSFVPAILPGENFYYSAIGIDKPGEREVGRGTMQANGTIAREAISGTLTSFTAGKKSVALVAAATWFTSVQAALGAPSGGNSQAATRSALAAMPSAQSPVQLVENGREGLFKWDGANLAARVTNDTRQAVYVPPTSQNGSSGAWVRVWDGKEMRVEWFGAVGDSNGTTGTDNYAAILAAAHFRVSDSNWLNISPTILFGPGTREASTAYRVSATMDMHTTFHFKGRNSGHNGDAPFVSELVWPTDTKMLRVHAATTDFETTKASGPTASTGSIVEGLCFSQVAQGTDRTAYGIWLRGRATIERCTFRWIAGHPIYIKAQAGGGGSLEGNANDWEVLSCFVHSCGGNALHIEGNDANAGYCEHFITHTQVGGCGIFDDASFSNTYDSPQITGYGNGGVTHAGNHWYLIASSNVGTTPGTNSAVWRDAGAGVVNVSYPAWDAGTTYYPELPMLVIRGNATVIDPYQEGGSGVLAHAPSSTVLGGNMAFTVDTPVFRPPAISWPLCSQTGVGGRITTVAGTALATSNGTFAYTTIGGTNSQTVNGRQVILEHNVQADGDLKFLWHWVLDSGGYDQILQYQSRKVYWRNTGVNTAATFGRSTAQPYMFNPYGLVISPENGGDGRIWDAGTVVPASGYHAAGEIRWSTAAAGMGWRCTVAGTPGTWVEFKPYSPSTLGVGYSTGDGGTVTQATNKSTGVTLNKKTGEIAMNNATLAAGEVVSFTFTNSNIAAADVVAIAISNGATAGAYVAQVDNMAAGSCRISLRNMTAGALGETVRFTFAIVKGSFN